MAVFRVERTRDYTVICNHHLKDMNLSLKAKGLLSIMLSLPDTWNYTTRGLAAICKEGVDAIRSGIQELEKAGYIIRRRLRGPDGRITDTEYVIYEQPIQPNTPPAPEEPDAPSPGAEGPDMPAPHTENPYAVGPGAVAPFAGNPAQLNINQVSTDGSKTNLSCLTEGQVRARRAEIQAQIEYDTIRTVENQGQIDEFVEIMLEVSLAESPTIHVGQEREYPTAFVRERFAQLNSSHIERILDAILENSRRVRNTKAYLLAALFDAPASKENHYTMQVNSG
nr:DUF6017 domain-containing protein [uncultured Oscillibacter sp.]